MVRRAGPRRGRARSKSGWPALKTKADAEAYVRSVQERIRECFGPEPERTPLNASVTGIVERDAYRIEKVIFESRPNFPVTANLYVPKGRKLPLPGVVGSCGHSATGKAIEAYQSFAQGLARQGYVVLIFDPIGQGERLQYVGRSTEAAARDRRRRAPARGQPAVPRRRVLRRVAGLGRHPGPRLSAHAQGGRSEARRHHRQLRRRHDEHLAVRPRAPLDDGRPGLLRHHLPPQPGKRAAADTEQCPPRALALGLDHADFLAAMAPKPVIILAKEKDYFDVRGSLGDLCPAEAPLHAARQAGEHRPAHRPDRARLLAGKPRGDVPLVQPRHRHLRRQDRAGADDREGRGAAVHAARPGRRAEAANGVLVHRRRSRKSLAGKRGEVARRGAASRPLPTCCKLPQAAGRAARTTASSGPLARPQLSAPLCHDLRRRNRAGHSRAGHAAGATSRTSRARRRTRGRRCSTSRTIRPTPSCGRAAGQGAARSRRATAPFYACDVRGIGESRPDTCGSDQFLNPYGSDYFYATHSLMLDRPYVGQKTFDLLRVLDWLASLGHREVHLAAKGWGAIPATFAAVLTTGVTQVTLKQGLTSYAAIAESEDYNWPLSALRPASSPASTCPTATASCKRPGSSANSIRRARSRASSSRPVKKNKSQRCRQ